MPTTKTRINITADSDIKKSLVMAAKRDGVPRATKAAELLRIALELEEDLALNNLAEDRLSGGRVNWLSHKKVWK